MTGTVATAWSASFRLSPPRGMIRSTVSRLGGQLRELLAPAPRDEADAALRQARRSTASAAIRASAAFECDRRGGAAQDDRVARLQAQRGGVDRHVRARLVDDGDDAERHAHLAHVEAVGQAVAVDHLADRVGERGDLADRRGAIAADALLVEAQAVEQRVAELRVARPPACRARWPRGSPRAAPRGPRRSPRARRP